MGRLFSQIYNAGSAAFILVAAAAGISAAYAQTAGSSTCSASVGAMNFPALTGSGASGTTGTAAISVTCSNTPSWITPKNGVPFCMLLIPNSTDAAYTSQHQRVMYLNGNPGSDQVINFQFLSNYRDCGGQSTPPTVSCVWGSSDATNYGAGLLDFYMPTKTPKYPYQGRAVITSRQPLWAGSYSNNFTLRLVWNDTQYPAGTPNTTTPTASGGGGMYLPSAMCYGGAPITGSKDYQLTAKAVVQNNCTAVTAGAMSFGSYISLSAVQRAQAPAATITTQCSGGAKYQVGLSAGNAASGVPWGGGWRGMKCTGDSCGSSVIYYNLYKDSARQNVWGDINTDNTMKDDSGRGGKQIYTVYGGVGGDKVQASLGQPVPPLPGAYKDTVIVTLLSYVTQQ